ncbi:hypothetical protein [Runella limosa]|uniref:hypothetical protein n=1 Tax=Runella limosa TaxID=370978 RepID=UPI0003FB0C5C|nr:hypothetical protein [Runella limosa]
MTQRNSSEKFFFDSDFRLEEQLPRQFSVTFNEVDTDKVQVLFNESYQIGDIINDNSYQNDFYRYHDIFHYTFAAILGWSPCARAMIKCKRKSDRLMDEVEDGARAAITEEAISLLIFNEARKKDFFKNIQNVSNTTLQIIKEMTEPFEVKVRTRKEWNVAILKAYEMFRLLSKNRGGKVIFDAFSQNVAYLPLT